MRPTEGEVRDAGIIRREREACCLGGDQRGDADGAQQARLDDHRLGKWRRDPEDRLVGEGDFPLGHALDVACETKIVQERQKFRLVLLDVLKVGELLVVEAEPLQVVERWLESGDQHETTRERV